MFTLKYYNCSLQVQFHPTASCWRHFTRVVSLNSLYVTLCLATWFQALCVMRSDFMKPPRKPVRADGTQLTLLSKTRPHLHKSTNHLHRFLLVCTATWKVLIGYWELPLNKVLIGLDTKCVFWPVCYTYQEMLVWPALCRQYSPAPVLNSQPQTWEAGMLAKRLKPMGASICR